MTEQKTAGININPVEGLKLVFALRGACSTRGRNQHQPSRGIKTEKILGEPGVLSVPESTSTQSRD